MKQRAYTVRLYEYDQLDELSKEQVLLVNSAVKLPRMHMHPIRNTMWVLLLRLANGEIVIGNNQENAAYPSGLCAERVAIFYAGARYPDVPVESIAIAAIRNGILQEEPVAPCGACRQVLYEKESQGEASMEVILYGSKKIQILSTGDRPAATSL